SEEEVNKVAENFKNILTTNGAKIVDFAPMGQRELAYDIKKFKNAYYFLTTIEASDDKAIKEFDRLSLISGDVLRHLITKLDK
ncbi:MAG: 30S ribosomal protein S6, partial [Vagococcus sp.]